MNDRAANSFRFSQDSPNNPFKPLEKWGSATHFGRIMNPRSASLFAVILPTVTPLLRRNGQFIVPTQTDQEQYVFFPLFLSFSSPSLWVFPPLPHKLSSWICYYGNHTRAAVGKSGVVFSFTTVIPQRDASLKL